MNVKAPSSGWQQKRLTCVTASTMRFPNIPQHCDFLIFSPLLLPLPLFECILNLFYYIFCLFIFASCVAVEKLALKVWALVFEP